MYPQPARSKRSILLAGESSCRTAQGFRWTASMTCVFSFGNHGAVVKIPILGRWPKCVFAFRPYSVSKSLAEFAARRRQRNIIIFSRDMCVRENTARAASVEFVRYRRTNYARSRPQTFCRKNPEGFSTVSKQKRRIATTLSLCRGKGVRGIFRYLSCFFFLLRAAAPVAAPPLASSRAIHKERLLVSPVGGVFGSFAVTVSAFLISLVPSLSL